jgi:hypothetical protein
MLGLSVLDLTSGNYVHDHLESLGLPSGAGQVAVIGMQPNATRYP